MHSPLPEPSGSPTTPRCCIAHSAPCPALFFCFCKHALREISGSSKTAATRARTRESRRGVNGGDARVRLGSTLCTTRLVREDQQVTHTHTPTENNTPVTDTHTHDKNNTPNPKTNTPPHKHLTPLEGGATTVRATSHGLVDTPSVGSQDRTRHVSLFTPRIVNTISVFSQDRG